MTDTCNFSPEKHTINDNDMSYFKKIDNKKILTLITCKNNGNQRLIVIAYKICELLVFKNIKKEYPVLLLDDVFSEIDIKKRNNIIKFLKSDMQVIITTTDINDISLDLVNLAKVFKIKNGEIKVKGGRENGRKSTRKL